MQTISKAGYYYWLAINRPPSGLTSPDRHIHYNAGMTYFVEVLKKDTEEVLHVGEFDTQRLAIACAKRAIDGFLLREYQMGMTSDGLFTIYTTRGEYPCIFRDGDATLNVPFSHLTYAMARCGDVCGADVQPQT